MNAHILALALLTLTGCHQVCGSSAPIWVQADCANTPDVADSRSDCDVGLSLTVDGASTVLASEDDEVTLTAYATNLTDAPVTLTLVEPCPADLAVFSGLGEGYDYYGSCLAGACTDSGEVVTEVIEVGEEIEISTVIALDGGDCNAPVAPGSYEVSFSLPLTDDPQPSVCAADPVELVVQ